MNELVKLVMQKTGIDENMAEQIVGIVVNHLKDKLPGPASSQIDSILRGETPKEASGIMGMLSGLFKR